MRNTTLCIIAHVDAGKTTLSEQILFLGGARRTPGRVDHGDTALDRDPIERQRGITIFADQAAFEWRGRPWTLIDTPGHVDFAAEAERSLLAPDVCLLLVEASGSLKPHAAMLAELARKRGLPLMLFINKCDLSGADPERLMQETARRLGAACLAWPPEAEAVAELDEAFLDTYLSDEWQPDDLLAAARRAFLAGALIPAFPGAALKNQGVEALLDALDRLVPEPDDEGGGMSAVVYKARRDEKGARVAFLRMTGGVLRPRDTITTGDQSEKVQEIRAYSGDRFRLLEAARAGDVVDVTGLMLPACGDVYREGQRVSRGAYDLTSALAAGVEALDGTDRVTLLEKLRLLEDEDPQLRVESVAEGSQLQVHVMGPVQLEILEGLMLSRFGIRVRFTRPRVLYRETLLAPVLGCGHYEPLRHYAEVHLRLSPGPRGSGITFASECHVDTLALSFQNLIRTHVFERVHRGVLTGSPITDIRVTLITGRAHLKHTEGGDFRQATYRAIRQGLMCGESALLEPWYDFEFMVPAASAGRVLSDVAARSGQVQSHETLGDTARICGRGPVSSFADYGIELRALTHGEGGASFRMSGYDLCHNAGEVIEAIGYRPGADTEQSPDSVFCSHGAGYTVPWNEARTHMHCACPEE